MTAENQGPGPENLADAGPGTPGRKSGKGSLLLFLVGFSLLGWAIYSNRAQLARCLSGEISYSRIMAGFLLHLAGMAIAFIRWFFLVRMQGIPIPLADSLRLSIVGALFNLVIPGAVGGDLVKAAYLAQMDIPKVRAFSSMVIDRLLGLLGLFLLASGAGLSAWNSSPPEVHRITIFAILVTMVVLLFLTMVFGGFIKGQSPKAIELSAMSAAYRSHLPAIAFWAVASMLIHVCNTWAFYSVSMGILPDLKIGLATHFQIVPLVLFSTAVPLPLGAIGLSENVSEFLFKNVGHPDGAIAMMGFRILQFGFGLCAVPVYLANLSKMKQLSSRQWQ
ncbi:MAG: lysylphosphatidylglycerol synthase transmembrane domain-containing protein [bacterium]